MGGLFQVAPQLVAGGGYSASSTNMTMTVNQAVWSLPDPTNASAVFFSPTDSTGLSVAAAPATGGRIDLVVVKQNNVENGDADSRVNVYVVPGIASGSPVAPAVPAGASVYLAILVNAGVTNLYAATFTNYMQTAFADPPLQAPTLAALKSAAGALSQLGIVTADGTLSNNGIYLWNGSLWIPVGGSALPHMVYSRSTAYTWPTSAATMSWDAALVDGVLSGLTLGSGVFTCTTPGVYQIAVSLGANSTGAVQGLNVALVKNGLTVLKGTGATSTATVTAVEYAVSIRLAVGDTFQIQYYASASSAGSVTSGNNFLAIDYLHG